MGKKNPFDPSEEIIGEGIEVITIIHTDEVLGKWYKSIFPNQDIRVFRR